MDNGLKSRIEHVQERYRDSLLTALTLLLLILVFIVAPFNAEGMIAFQALGFIIALVMIMGVLILSTSPIAISALLVAFCMNIVGVVFRLRAQSSLDICLVAGAWSILALTLGFVVSRAVFAAGPVSYHRVVGAVLLYLLIGLTFMSLFVFVGLLLPNAFSGVAVEDTNALASNLIYFSFVTLTSTGYGDILPLDPIARSLCNLKSIIGQLYPATLLARLVTLELSNRRG